jgi:hypothetical protein
MRVTLVVEFPGIDPNSAEADEIVDALALDTVHLQEQWADKACAAYVDEVEAD